MKDHRFTFYLAVAAIVVATIGPALYLDHKENLQADLLSQAANRLSHVPAHFGHWSLRDEDSLSESVLKMLGCSSHLCRTYVHRETSEVVALVYLVGPAGPLAVHTPEICMTSREYENIRPAQSIDVTDPARTHQFFATLFRAKTLEGQKLNVYYGWSRDGLQWEAPQSPRMALGPLPMLYKLQVACAEPAIPTDEPTAGVTFLNELVNHLASTQQASN